MRTYALLLLAGLGAVVACTSSTASTAATGASTDGGTDPSTNPGTTADGGDAGTTVRPAEPLSASTFVYVRSVANDHDEIIAHDLATGAERTITNLRAADEEIYHQVAGLAVSPDRRSLVIATDYGPEAADLFTVSNRIFKLGVDGKGFVRLTPPWKNNGGGSASYMIDVRDPVFGKDGATVYFTFGEAKNGFGGTRTWSVSAAGWTLPALIDSAAACSDVGQASVSPADGSLMLVQSTCTKTADEGFFTYPAAGTPALVLGPNGSSARSPVGWAPDGSGFVVAVRTGNNDSLLLFDATTKAAPVTVVQGNGTITQVRSGAIAPDGKVVYCLRSSTGDDLHVIDPSVTPATDTAITTDGKSCSPRF